MDGSLALGLLSVRWQCGWQFGAWLTVGSTAEWMVVWCLACRRFDRRVDGGLVFWLAVGTIAV